MSELNKIEALRAYARTINNLDASYIEPYLAEDFHYASQMVYQEIESKDEFLDYIKVKLATMRASDLPVWAEMGELETYPGGPCVVVAQGSRDDLQGVVLARVEEDKIKRLAMCIVPPPQAARRTGEYPT